MRYLLILLFFFSFFAFGDVTIPSGTTDTYTNWNYNRTGIYLLRDLYLADDSANTMKLVAPDLADDATVFQFPADNGVNLQYLMTDGNGVTSWEELIANPDFDNVTIEGTAGDGFIEMADQSTEPTSPSGTNDLRIFAEGKKIKYKDSSGTVKEVGSGSGGSSGINLLAEYNYNFENGDDGSWTETGSSVFVVTSDAANIYYGAFSGSWDPSASGEFLTSHAMTIPDGLAGKYCLLEFQYKGGDSDIDFYAWNGSSIIDSSTRSLTTASNWTIARTWFTCPSQGSTIYARLESNANSPIVYLDEFFDGIKEIGSTAAMSEWGQLDNPPELYQASTETALASYTKSNHSARRVGDSLEFSIDYKSDIDRSTATNLLIYIPDHKIDLNKMAAGLMAGNCYVQDTSSTTRHPVSPMTIGYTDNYIYLRYADGYSNVDVTDFDTNDVLRCIATVPIEGWTDGLNTLNVDKQSPIRAGFIQTYAGSNPPDGWLDCDGSEYPISDYPELYAAIGSTWNTGGETAGYFRVPDFETDNRFLRSDGGSLSVGDTQTDDTELNGITVSGGTASGTFGSSSHKHIGTGGVVASVLRLNRQFGSTTASYANSYGTVIGKTDATNSGSWYYTGNAVGTSSVSSTPASISDNGSLETRPNSAVVKYIIKAFNDSADLSGNLIATETNAGLVPNIATYYYNRTHTSSAIANGSGTQIETYTITKEGLYDIDGCATLGSLFTYSTDDRAIGIDLYHDSTWIAQGLGSIEGAITGNAKYTNVCVNYLGEFSIGDVIKLYGKSSVDSTSFGRWDSTLKVVEIVQ